MTVLGQLGSGALAMCAGAGATTPGAVGRAEVQQYLGATDVLVSADLNAACPNSVIEAMAAGVPVVGFDTGALRELVTSETGIVIPYRGDPWVMQRPTNTLELAQAIVGAFDRAEPLARHSRMRAATQFDIRVVASRYLSVLFPQVFH
jgi:glycosyltransferase involved in cell wall biosynthesis